MNINIIYGMEKEKNISEMEKYYSPGNILKGKNGVEQDMIMNMV